MDWESYLRERASELRAGPLGPELAARALDLARALEDVVPDRIRAIEMYLLAWKADRSRPDMLARARNLCHEVGDFATAATIAHIQYQQDRDPELLFMEGLAWLDSSQPDRAVRPLMAAQKALPDREAVRVALATARLEWPDRRAAASRLAREADELVDDGAASRTLTHAARILRGLRVDKDEYTALLCRALDRDPWNEGAYLLLEDHLVCQRDDELLLQVNDMRAASAESPERAVEAYRRSGTRLLLRTSRLAVGLRLVLRSVETAHRHGLARLPGYIASMSLLLAFSEEARAIPQFLELLWGGIAVSVKDRDRAWLAIHGLALAWDELRDEELAHRFALVAAEVAPEHPTLVAFASERNMDQSGFPPRADPDDLLIYLDERHTDPALAAEAFNAMTREVSATGVSLVTDLELDVGSEVSVTLTLPTPHRSDLESYSVPATVVRRQPEHGYELMFVDPPASLAAHVNELMKQQG